MFAFKVHREKDDSTEQSPATDRLTVKVYFITWLPQLWGSPPTPQYVLKILGRHALLPGLWSTTRKISAGIIAAALALLFIFGLASPGCLLLSQDPVARQAENPADVANRIPASAATHPSSGIFCTTFGLFALLAASLAMPPALVRKGHLFKFHLYLLHPEAPEPTPPDSARSSSRTIALVIRLAHPLIARRILRDFQVGATRIFVTKPDGRPFPGPTEYPTRLLNRLLRYAVNTRLTSLPHAAPASSSHVAPEPHPLSLSIEASDDAARPHCQAAPPASSNFIM